MSSPGLGPVILRADASFERGTGHVMRSLALAEEQRIRGGRAIFAINANAGEIIEQVRGRGFEVTCITAMSGSENDSRTIVELAERVAASAIIVDGYSFGGEYYRSLRQSNAVIAALDDFGRGRFPVDVLINPSLAGAEYTYYVLENTSLLLGNRFIMLRPEFLWNRSRSGRSAAKRPSRVLISFGGSDVAGATSRALMALPTTPVDALVVLGPNSRNRLAVEAAASAAKKRGHSVEILQNVDNMARVVGDCDIAIVGCGSTVWELAYMRTPTVAYMVAENQRAMCESLVRGNAIVGGQHIDEVTDSMMSTHIGSLVIEPRLRRMVSTNLSKYVDGRGCMRIIDELSKRARIASPPSLRVRLAS